MKLTPHFEQLQLEKHRQDQQIEDMQEDIDKLKNEKLANGFELDKLRQKTKNDKE
jgi:predicted  nucleic acid-binding Zn-ribbon protein|tara:strand:- start:1650 stop:1814 length:165 start_codon:yes stop_codon:yes gene_type:complete